MTTLTPELEKEIRELRACKDCLDARRRFQESFRRESALHNAPETTLYAPCGECLDIIVTFIQTRLTSEKKA